MTLTIPHATICRQQAHRAVIDRLYAREPVACLPALCGNYAGYYGDDAPDTFRRWCADELPRLRDEVIAAAGNPTAFFPLLLEFAPLGVHYVDALLGARVYRVEEQLWSAPLPGSLGGLVPFAVREAPLVRWTVEAIRTLLACLPADMAVTFPIFSSPLNVAINLFGEGALMEIVEPTDGTLRGLDIITETIIALHRLMQATFPAERVRFYCASTRFAPVGVGHICGCSTQLLSGETYQALIAPRDARVLAVYPGGGTIHLCGRHTQHLPCWRDMALLRAVQLNDTAADDFLAYYTELRPDQLIYITPTERMPLERMLAISGGHRVIVQMPLAEPIPLA